MIHTHTWRSGTNIKNSVDFDFMLTDYNCLKQIFIPYYAYFQTYSISVAQMTSY